jgi:hypothetical protein
MEPKSTPAVNLNGPEHFIPQIEYKAKHMWQQMLWMTVRNDPSFPAGEVQNGR